MSFQNRPKTFYIVVNQWFWTERYFCLLSSFSFPFYKLMKCKAGLFCANGLIQYVETVRLTWVEWYICSVHSQDRKGLLRIFSSIFLLFLRKKDFFSLFLLHPENYFSLEISVSGNIFLHKVYIHYFFWLALAWPSPQQNIYLDFVCKISKKYIKQENRNEKIK